eukprot:GGOE01047402.1.p3 GENE.GGOE01047402.1~~GGOE01047402.1.p3  ORF type:complete len:119 (+),score=15.68 GGOE01047402.1:350-706(+)
MAPFWFHFCSAGTAQALSQLSSRLQAGHLPLEEPARNQGCSILWQCGPPSPTPPLGSKFFASTMFITTCIIPFISSPFHSVCSTHHSIFDPLQASRIEASSPGPFLSPTGHHWTSRVL